MKAHLLNVYMRMPQRNSYCHPFDGPKLAQGRIEDHQRDPGSWSRGDESSCASCQDRSRSSRSFPKRTSVFTCGLSVPTSHFQTPPTGASTPSVVHVKSRFRCPHPSGVAGAEFFLSGFGSERNGWARPSTEASSVELANPRPRPKPKRRANVRRTRQPCKLPCSVRQSLDRRTERIM